MNIKHPKIKWYWRFLIASIVSTLLLGMVSIFSRFREAPQIDMLLIVLLTVMAYATLEMVRISQFRLRKIGFLKSQSLKNITTFIGSIVLGSLFYCLLFYAFKWLDFYMNSSEPPMLGHMVSALLIGSVMSTIFALFIFSKNWKHQYYDTYLKNEAFKKEIATANLSILKNQLDPHFMFNNFNTLYYLIDEDQDLAKKFLKNIATVYRYILQHNDTHLIPLIEEYDIVKQYFEIIKQRYADSLKIEDHISPFQIANKKIPPLALQQLIENIIKHNRIDSTSPLTISLRIKEGYFHLTNTLNPKRPEYSEKTGLKNIEQRYSYFTDKKVNLNKTKESFSISIPLITSEDERK